MGPPAAPEGAGRARFVVLATDREGNVADNVAPNVAPSVAAKAAVVDHANARRDWAF